jgi:RHS repeat-associated protein
VARAGAGARKRSAQHRAPRHAGHAHQPVSRLSQQLPLGQGGLCRSRLHARVAAGCTPAGGCNYLLARNRHFSHLAGTNLKSTSLESEKKPFENRLWYAYPGQTNATTSGSFNQPIAIGRVLDDGTTQLTQSAYDTTSFFNLTQVTDPLGRKTTYSYPNGIDLAAITQVTANGLPTTIAQWSYDYRHRPLFHIDAAGQTTSYTWNAAGQIASVTNPLGQKTSYQYDSLGRLSTITNANNATAATFTYDAFDRLATFTDSEGWTVAYVYDAANRLTKTTYPDGTSETYGYDNLDMVSYRDRLGRVWSYTYDANRRRTQVRDPAGNDMLFGYDQMSRLTSLTDRKGNITQWAYDVQGRLASKTYADGSMVTYVYEATTSRVRAVVDALGQRKEYSYARDDLLTDITYLNSINPTPSVSFAYDPSFPRLVSMTDGTGTTTYSYVPAGAQGALEAQQEVSPLPNSAITYTYDALGRVSARSVAGSGIETFQYDAIGRLVGRSNDLGAFTLSYLGQTDQIVQRQLAGSSVATTWSYLPNIGDRRLAGINNVGLSAGQFSTFQFATLADGSIAAITETSDIADIYPGTGRQVASYNKLNQTAYVLDSVLRYDANGNLLSDGQRIYAWDAEDRLVGITYPGEPGKQTAFAYDGAGRRIAISSTPAGGPTATASYVWCNESLCQARNAGGATKRAYYDEGELVPGAPAQSYYYGIDQLGSVRRSFASTGGAPAYAFDPYGRALQGTAPLTEFGYAGMLYNVESGLYLTNFRAYDPFAGRWLSRDPIGEESDPAANLYAYVGGDPIGKSDPTGECPWCVRAGVGAGIGAAASLAGQLLGNGGRLDCVDWGEVGGAALAGAGLGGLSAIGGLGAAARGAGTLGANPFAGKSANEVAKMLTKRGYAPKGPDPAAGRGTYVNPNTGRGYHIDANHPAPKGPHVGVHRPRDLRDVLNPRDYPMGGP